MDENGIKELVRILSQSKIIISGDVTPDAMKGVEVEILAEKIIENRKENAPLWIIGPDEIRDIIESIRQDKAPQPVEIVRHADFKPIASEVDADYAVNNRPNERAEGTTMDFVAYFNSRLRKVRAIIESGRSFGLMQSLEGLRNLASGREVGIVGVVTSRMGTKKGNVLLVLEDGTGDAKVVIMNGTSEQSKRLFEKANYLINDEVIAVKGKISGELIIASEILWPDVPIKEVKKSEQDIAIAFMSDIHVGSKRFLEKNFVHMIEWLNGNVEGRHKALAGKIKYIVIAGDVVDGIGIYPGQDRDLAMLDIYDQYTALFNFIDAIPDYIHVFVQPGNHDAVQLSEPQPPLTTDLLKDFKKDNVHFLSNPGYVTLNGIDVAAYHGRGLDSMINVVPGLSYAHPEKAMVELLKRRHFCPIYGNNVSTSIVPSKEDNLVMERIPDILHMGHVHKNGIANYHGVEIVNSGTWQSRTDYQIKQGHIPTPGILPIYEMKTRNFTSIDFMSEE